jgi:RNA polymerase sigma factor (sigma-70 family)
MEDDRGALEEGVLRTAVLSGDAAAWRVLYERNVDSLYAHVLRRTGGEAERAEEAFQETWMAAVRAIRKFDPAKGTFQAWLRGIAENVLRSQARRSRLRRRVEGTSLEAVPAEAAADPGPRQGDLSERIARALAELPFRYRQVLRAKYDEKLPVAEIASRSGESLKAIESLLSRAREAFRSAYRRSEERG